MAEDLRRRPWCSLTTGHDGDERAREGSDV